MLKRLLPLWSSFGVKLCAADILADAVVHCVPAASAVLCSGSEVNLQRGDVFNSPCLVKPHYNYVIFLFAGLFLQCSLEFKAINESIT